MPLINCEIEFNLSRSKYCIIYEPWKTLQLHRDNPVDATLTTGQTFQRNKAKLYIPVVTLSIRNIIKFWENIKQGFKRIISWNKYRSEITAQPKARN